MDKEEISRQKWDGYLKDLYDWVSEKYELLIAGEIDNDEYAEHLKYYDKEKVRIENIVLSENPDMAETPEEEAARKKKFTQETFENFFGVKLNTGSQTTQLETNNTSQQINYENVENLDIDVPAVGNQPLAVNPTPEVSSQSQQNILAYSEEKVAPKSDFAVFEKQDIEFAKQIISANILLIGDSTVGRTSIRRAWMGKHFIKSHLTTIGASIEKKTMTLDGWTINVTLTDLGGQDFYSELRRNFYRNIDGAVIVFDLTKPDTFRRIDYWVKEFYRESKKLVPFILVGNKYDLPNRVIPKDKGVILSEKFSKMTMPNFKVRYLESSAKSGKDINEIFDTIGREIKSFKIQKRRKIQK